MNRLFRLFVVVAILATVFTFVSAKPAAAAGCLVASGTGPSTVKVTFVQGHQYQQTHTKWGTFTFTAKTSFSFWMHLDAGHTYTLYDLSCTTEPDAVFTDGRRNKMDADQSAAVYCNVPNPGDIRVYAVYQSEGILAFTATKAEINRVSAKPARNTLIKQGKGAQLWRLTNGNLEVRRNTETPGEVYTYQFPGC